ncbi:Flp family type IVb pilin [Orbus sturtevantii]|uniref:Flp family type IVb pilin n=1 Tax=Orbus sturtevantii TaxID=3074109 RepID=UPI00370D3CB9
MKLSNSIRKFAQKFVKNEAGVTAIEYAIVAAGVAAVVMVIFKPDSSGAVYEMLRRVFTLLSNTLVDVING